MGTIIQNMQTLDLYRLLWYYVRDTPPLSATSPIIRHLTKELQGRGIEMFVPPCTNEEAVRVLSSIHRQSSKLTKHQHAWHPHEEVAAWIFTVLNTTPDQQCLAALRACGIEA
jgi:hypothetical protein